MIFQIPATVTKVQTMQDHSVQIRIETQDIDADATAKLFQLNGKLGWMLFAESMLKEEDVVGLPEIEPEFKGDKTPGQRLRGVMYRFWEQKGKPRNFEEFYRTHMEKLINQFKEKLV